MISENRRHELLAERERLLSEYRSSESAPTLALWRKEAGVRARIGRRLNEIQRLLDLETEQPNGGAA